MEIRKISFKKSESFYIRDGWIGKAIHVIKEHENTEIKNIFSKNDGIINLGIGSNMVKGLKYWLSASGIIYGKDNKLTEFGQLIFKFDPYLDSMFTWYFIHYYLVRNDIECPIFHRVFNMPLSVFKKSNLLEYLKEYYPETKEKYLEDDMNVFLHSYVTDEVILNPEDNYACPLAQLKLISREKNLYKKKASVYKKLSYLVVYYVLQDIYEGKASFVIEDSMKVVNSPVKVFNLDKYTYLQYLEDMSRNELITINRTAGLNTVYFNRHMNLEDFFRENFEL